MFLEVYAIPLNKYSNTDDNFKTQENIRLIETTGIRIRPSARFAGRAEIIVQDGTIIHTAGSVQELKTRIEQIDQVAKI